MTAICVFPNASVTVSQWLSLLSSFEWMKESKKDSVWALVEGKQNTRH